MTGKALNFSDLINYSNEYIECYGLNHSEKLVLRDYYDFVYHRHNGMLKLGKELEEWQNQNGK